MERREHYGAITMAYPAERRLGFEMKHKPLVVLVEDNSADVFLVGEALKIHDVAVSLEVLADGDQAVEWVSANEAGAAETPVAVVLDLNLPKRSGADVLGRIRSSAKLAQTPVIIFTSSNSNRDRALCDRFAGTTYLRKSADFDEFVEIGAMLKRIVTHSVDRTN